MSPDGTDAAKVEPTLRGALRSLRLVWKVNGLFLLILVATLSISLYISNLNFERAQLALAREMSLASSNRIVDRIQELMVGHEAGTLASVVTRMASENPAFSDIRLLAHDGRVLASRFAENSEPVGTDSWPCTLCHLPGNPQPSASAAACCDVIQGPDGTRAVSVITPVYREEGCSGTGCHSDAPADAVLGVLQADFSLAGVDALVAQRNRNTLLAILFSLVLGSLATWWMTERLLGRRIRALREGAQRLADHDFSFRFSDPTGDGLAQVVGVFDTMTSELSDALSELMSTKEYLQAIIENSADIIITVDPDGLIRTFNPGAERVLGYHREEVIGKRIEMLFANPRERDAAIRQLEKGEPVVNYLTHFVTKDGDVRNVMLTLSRLLAPDGTPLGTMGVSKDLTEELKLQRQLLQSKRMAALGQAITGIQHSIKNMLNVMKGGSYMVKLGLEKDDRGMLLEGWNMVREGIEDMTQMSISMLDFARTRKLRIQPTDLAHLAQRVRELSLAKFREAGVDLVLNVEPGLPLVECDVESIRSVIMDLLGNALDACSWKEYREGERPRVTLRVLPSGVDTQVLIEVIDNGIGMTDEVRRRVFTPFFSTKEKKGTGMGLAVVSRIVTSHEGQTTVESEPGKGATFRVLLPIKGPSLREE